MREMLQMSEVLQTRRTTLNPRLYPDEVFVNFSLPAYDRACEPEIVRGSEIDSAKFLTADGTILIAKLNPRIKRVWRVESVPGRRLLSSTEFINIVPKDPNTCTFLSHLLASDLVYRELERVAEGTTNSHVRFRPAFLEKLTLKDVAVRESWSRVADVLENVDCALKNIEALIAKMQVLKAGIMQDLFTHGVTFNGSLRPSFYDAPHLYKESPVGWIPVEWTVATMRDRRRTDRAHLKTGPFGSSLKTEHWVDNGRPVITIGALGEGELIQSDLLHVSEETAARLCEYTLECGDVIFSRVADVGRSAVISSAEHGWLMSSNLMRISLDPKAVRPWFLQAQLSYDSRIRQQIRANVNAGGRDVANSAVLNRLVFPWPPPEEQDRIMERVFSLTNTLLLERAQRDRLLAVKRGLMHDLLTGQVRVSVD